jgi:RNA polymerase sigma factor (sigma-70 family)
MTERLKADYHKLLGYIRSKISSPEESEDLLQDVYVQLMSNLNVLDSIDNLTGWLYTVARNRIIDWYRKKKQPVISLNEPLENGIRFEDVLAEDVPEGLDGTDRDYVYQAILESIDQLPEKQRFVFIEQVINGRTFRELAEITGESQNTLIARKRYAVASLRKELTEIRELIYER